MFTCNPMSGIKPMREQPFIFLVHSENKNTSYNDNLDVGEDGTNNIVHLSSEGEGLYRAGNRAIIEHQFRNGCYNSLFLFTLSKEDKTSNMRYIGEYYLKEVVYKDAENHENDSNTFRRAIDYFVLHKIPNKDDSKIFYVEKILEDNQLLIYDMSYLRTIYDDQIELPNRDKNWREEINTKLSSNNILWDE